MHTSHVLSGRGWSGATAGLVGLLALLMLNVGIQQPARGGGASYTVQNVGFVYDQAGIPPQLPRMNASGVVAGFSDDPLEPVSDYQPARSQAPGVGGDPDRTGHLAGTAFGAAYGINDTGNMVGLAVPGTGSSTFGFFSTGGAPQALSGRTKSSLRTTARDINNAGQMCGASTNDSGAAETAVLWSTPGSLISLGTLGGSTSFSYGINQTGQVTGRSELAFAPRPGPRGPGVTHAFRYTSGSGMQDLGVLSGGSFSAGHDINGSGVVCGGSSANGDDDFFAFRQAGTGPMQSLGALQTGGSSDAFGINSAGTIVGCASVGSIDHAFIWTQSGGMVDLNTLIPSGSGWVLICATDINDQGMICGFGTFNGEDAVWRLIPSGPADTEDPNISGCSVSPRSVAYSGGTVTVTATITDNVGVSTATAYFSSMSGSTSTMLSRQSGNTWRGSATLPANGTAKDLVYSIYIAADDAAGNMDSDVCGDVTVRGNPNVGPRLQVTPRSLNFGTVRRGQTVCREVTLRNIGTETLTGEIEPPLPPYSVLPPGYSKPPTKPVPYDLDPGDSIVVQVCFTPERDGTFGGQLPITSTDPSQTRVSVRARGASGQRCRPLPFK